MNMILILQIYLSVLKILLMISLILTSPGHLHKALRFDLMNTASLNRSRQGLMRDNVNQTRRVNKNTNIITHLYKNISSNNSILFKGINYRIASKNDSNINGNKIKVHSTTLLSLHWPQSSHYKIRNLLKRSVLENAKNDISKKIENIKKKALEKIRNIKNYVRKRNKKSNKVEKDKLNKKMVRAVKRIKKDMAYKIAKLKPMIKPKKIEYKKKIYEAKNKVSNKIFVQLEQNLSKYIVKVLNRKLKRMAKKVINET